MRIIRFTVAALVLCTGLSPAPAAAQAKAKSQILPNGTVKSVSSTSLVVTSVGKDTTFAIDTRTQVIGKGVGTKSKAKGDKPSIVDLVKEGDRVTVTYQDAGGTMRASRIEVASSKAAR
jgi:uncharacterized protein DUF5666